MKVNRREFLKVGMAAGSAAFIGLPARARAEADVAGAEESSVLVDTTLCIGCRACEAACSEANALPAPSPGEPVFDAQRTTSMDAFTVVNRFEKGADHSEVRYVKTQCMHCVAPACASACPNRALDKKRNGPVTYDAGRCMGCRYCMVACPFQIPKYSYNELAPRVRKCTFCAPRQARGLAPACATVCPSGALTFGKRAQLLDAANLRIYQNPNTYVHHVYGEREAGGTNWLYISDVPFEKLAMKVGVLETPYPDLVKGALGAPPFVMTLWPPLLMGLYAFSRQRSGEEERPSGTGEEKP